jgi:predicted metal-dependent hydrolase
VQRVVPSLAACRSRLFDITADIEGRTDTANAIAREATHNREFAQLRNHWQAVGQGEAEQLSLLRARRERPRRRRAADERDELAATGP